MNKTITKQSMYIILALLSVLTFSCKDENVDLYYTVTIISNGGTNYAPIQVKAGELIPQNKLYPAPIINDGGTFLYWSPNLELDTEFDFNTPVTGDMTLYAKWYYNTFKVSFEMNGAPSKPDMEVIEGRRIQLDKPTYEEHVFVGWYEDVLFTKIFNFSTTITADKKLYARWVEPSPASWFGINENGVLTACNPPEGTKIVVFPEGLKEIPAWFVLATGLNEPGKPGFPTGKNIEEFILPQSLEKIGEGAFKFAGITSIIIPPKVKELETVTFQGCDKLTSFTFAEGSTFERIKSTPSNEPVISSSTLESITFPPSMQYIGKYTLAGCTALKSVTFERSESPVIFYDYLPGGGVWLFGGYFPAQIEVPNSIKEAFLAEMRNVMQDYEFERMSTITVGY
ncbi:InlB B-repeat-containing protein [Petrimonas sp.]|jgi:uncharacterized repeat protein (TIGR02543 family)|uniref:InlB B-repeat-containing protein n=1 Tax=Petrimonas sp. TaxID=2023866 RepID=UPI002FC95B5D